MPMALGHEAADVVEELGLNVENLARGDHVVCVFVPCCGHCPSQPVLGINAFIVAGIIAHN
jgi:Zn-dependent alcohol dehydrogenase